VSEGYKVSQTHIWQNERYSFVFKKINFSIYALSIVGVSTSKSVVRVSNKSNNFNTCLRLFSGRSVKNIHSTALELHKQTKSSGQKGIWVFPIAYRNTTAKNNEYIE
jgi:hypothetical protein